MKTWTRDLIAGGAVVLLLGGGGLWATNVGLIGAPAKDSPAVIQEQDSSPEPTLTVTPTPTPAPTVAPVVETPVEEAPPADSTPDYGTPVPWVADPNPNSAEGGYWDTSACPSGSAHQAEDGNQYCD